MCGCECRKQSVFVVPFSTALFSIHTTVTLLLSHPVLAFRKAAEPGPGSSYPHPWAGAGKEPPAALGRVRAQFSAAVLQSDVSLACVAQASLTVEPHTS